MNKQHFLSQKAAVSGQKSWNKMLSELVTLYSLAQHRFN
jgi:hypothetical protein